MLLKVRIKFFGSVSHQRISVDIIKSLTFTSRHGVNGMTTAHGVIPDINLVVAAINYFV